MSVTVGVIVFSGVTVGKEVAVSTDFVSVTVVGMGLMIAVRVGNIVWSSVVFCAISVTVVTGIGSVELVNIELLSDIPVVEIIPTDSLLSPALAKGTPQINTKSANAMASR